MVCSSERTTIPVFPVYSFAGNDLGRPEPFTRTRFSRFFLRKRCFAFKQRSIVSCALGDSLVRRRFRAWRRGGRGIPPTIIPPRNLDGVACQFGYAEQVTLSFGRTGVAIIGGGPAGLAPLLAAHRRGRLADLLREGVTVVEQSGAVGEGTIGRWCISSDSTAFTFADCLAGPPDSELASLRNHPLTKEFVDLGEGTVPLQRAGEFLGLVGQAMNEVIEASPNGRVLKGCRAVSTQRTSTGWLTLIKDIESGRERTIDSSNVVLATGASQPIERLRSEHVAGVNLFERCGERLVQSGDVVSTRGFAAMSARLAALGPASKSCHRWRFHQRGGCGTCLTEPYAGSNVWCEWAHHPAPAPVAHFLFQCGGSPGRWIYGIWAG